MLLANFIFRNQRNVTLVFQRACILWTFFVHSKNIVPFVLIQLISIFTARKRCLRRLCFYTCLSVILFTGGVSASVHAGIHTSPPPGSRHPHPREQADIPPQEQTPPEIDTLREQTPHPAQSMLGDTSNKQAVHTLLECILVT